MVLAEHFARGEDRARAAEQYLRAAEQALRGADMPAVLARAQKGLDCGAAGETLAALHVRRMDGLIWSDAHDEAYEAALRALEASAPGCPSHRRALTGALSCIAHSDNRRALDALLPWLEPADLPVDAHGAELACRLIITLLWEGKPELAQRYLRRLESDIERAPHADPYVETCAQFARGIWLCQVARDPWGALNAHLAAVRNLDAAGHRFHALIASVRAAMACVWLGAFDAAEVHVERVLATEGAPAFALRGAMTFRIASLLERRRLTEALEQTDAALRQEASLHMATSRRATTRLLRVEAHCLRGELADAEEELRAVGDPATLVPLVRTTHLALMAEIRLRQGYPEEAAALAREALAWDRRAGAVFVPRQKGLAALYAESLHASGDVEAARTVIREARDELLTGAGKIGDPLFRKSFLENVSANAHTLALARAWLVEGPSPARHLPL